MSTAAVFVVGQCSGYNARIRKKIRGNCVDLTEADIAYFKRGDYENPRFWERFGERPSFRGASVLDVGCGHGSLCVHIANAGAARVVGVDTNPYLIAFANENLRLNYPELVGKVDFVNTALEHYPASSLFDYVVSKNTFEHITNMKAVIAQIAERLRPGGRLYAGFSGLYYSPFGFHGAPVLAMDMPPIPWWHLVLGKAALVRRANARQIAISDVRELELSAMTPEDYRRVFTESGLDCVKILYNRQRDKTLLASAAMGVFSALRGIPFLEPYFTVSMYCILRKPA